MEGACRWRMPPVEVHASVEGACRRWGVVRPLAGTSLEPRGPVAGTIADLWWLMLGLGAAVFVVVAVLLAIGLLRSGRGDGGWDERKQGGRWIVGGGGVLPVLVLLVVLGATGYAMRAMPTAASRDALTVEIVGHQWWFEVRYPDEGVTARELHIPVGRPVVLKLTSADVIHSFWVPELGGKMDMLPDSTNTLVLQADTPGRYQSRCAEFCGLHHADMRLLVIAEPAERFAAWLAAQR